MLGKLIKHEFIDTWKLLVLLDIAIIIIGAVIGLTIDDTSIAGTLYLLMLPSIGTIHLAYIVVHYYKSLYSSQGYLTFTLPATTYEVLFSKMLAAFIFETINVLCIIVSLGFVTWGLYSWSVDSFSLLKALFSESIELLSEFFSDVPMAISGIIYALAHIFYNLMTYFFAISLGQSYQKHRIIGAIVSYFGIKTVLAIASTSVSTALINNDIYDSVDMSSYTNIDGGSVIIMVLLIKAVEYLLVSAAMYFGCIHVTKHNLNLE